MPKIVHFRENCIGCNSCVEHAPQYWNLKDQKNGKALLKDADEKNGVYVKKICDFEADQNICAARSCPVRIIRVMDDNGKEIQ